MFDDDEFDRQFQRTQKMVVTSFIVAGVLSVGALGGIAWIVYVLLRHFGVI